MAIFPKIQNPCPYRNQLSEIMDGETCRMCKRDVVDLNGMSDAGRVAFMKSCSGEVCVSYSFLRPTLAAAALAVVVAATPMAAAAQDSPGAQEPEMEVIELFVGGIKDLANVEFIEDAADIAMADLPVVYEGAGADQATTTAEVAAPKPTGR